MTIKEYDEKAEIRKKIEAIDKILDEYKLREPCDGFRNAMFLGAGISTWYMGTLSFYVPDDILADRLRELLLQRKQELIDEFSKD